MNEPLRRIIAIDWSGDKTPAGQRRKIWIADWQDGAVALTNGRTRDEAADYLVAAARTTQRIAVGLDFAFSYPAWFVREHGCEAAERFWQLVANGRGEDWLAGANQFCWGSKGRRCPAGHREPEWKGFRRTDRAHSLGGIQPKSPFQIGGAGSVGTASLRGMPILHRLRSEGFSIWPFTGAGLPVALEIYPRLFTGQGNKSSRIFRGRHLAQPRYACLSRNVLKKAIDSEDAFDALCSVTAMKDHARELANLVEEFDPELKLEGKIWVPACDDPRSPGQQIKAGPSSV